MSLLILNGKLAKLCWLIYVRYFLGRANCLWSCQVAPCKILWRISHTGSQHYKTVLPRCMWDEQTVGRWTFPSCYVLWPYFKFTGCQGETCGVDSSHSLKVCNNFYFHGLDFEVFMQIYRYVVGLRVLILNSWVQ